MIGYVDCAAHAGTLPQEGETQTVQETRAYSVQIVLNGAAHGIRILQPARHKCDTPVPCGGDVRRHSDPQ